MVTTIWTPPAFAETPPELCKNTTSFTKPNQVILGSTALFTFAFAPLFTFIATHPRRRHGYAITSSFRRPSLLN